MTLYNGQGTEVKHAITVALQGGQWAHDPTWQTIPSFLPLTCWIVFV